VRGKVCVWFAGGSAGTAQGLCNAEGDLWESASYVKATMGLMKETRSHPASAKKKKRAEEGEA
jgi:hypothetical protein